MEISDINYKNSIECLEDLKSKKYICSEWIIDIFTRNIFNYDKYVYPLKLYRIKLSDFGFNKPTELQQFYKKIEKSDFSLVPPELALYVRHIYKDQPAGEWLRFATPMNSLIDSDGVPHLPKLGKALGKFFIETYWSYSKAIFHPHNEFVLADKNESS